MFVYIFEYKVVCIRMLTELNILKYAPLVGNLPDLVINLFGCF